MWKTVASVVVGGTALAAAPLVALPALGFDAGGIVAGTRFFFLGPVLT